MKKGRRLRSLTVIFVFICFNGFLQLQATQHDWVWAINAGGNGTGNVNPKSIVTDNMGNSYLTGHLYGTINLGSQTLTSANSDIFVAKIDTAGNWIWASQAGGAAWDLGDEIAVDAMGCVYVCGQFEETAMFGDIVLNSVGDSDAFFAKLDQNGNWLWAKSMGGAAYDEINSIAVDSNCNVYTTGQFQGIINLGGTTLDSGQSSKLFLTKTDSNGNWIWAIQSTEGSWATGLAICTDSSDSIYLSACFSNEITIGFHTVTGTGHYADVLVAKLSPEGVIDWTALAYGSEHEIVEDIALDANGAVFISGTSLSMCSYFGNIPVYSFGEEDTFVAKLDSSGNWLWAVRAGGDYYERVGNICIDTQGNAVYVGTSNGTAVFGNHIVHNNGFSNGFVCSISTSGTVNWVKPVVCPNYSYNHGVSSDPNGNIYICGSISADSQVGNIFIDVVGSTDLIVAKLSSASGLNDYYISAQPDLSIANYPNPFGSKTTLDFQISKAGNYRLALFNIKGQLVMESQVAYAQPGRYQKELETSHYPNGIYYLRVSNGSLQTTHKLVIAK